jgi:predicted MPP superfamily phosphohydrolase
MKRKISILPLAIASILYFLINWYVYSGLHTISQAIWLTVAFWGLALLSGSALIYSIVNLGRRGMDWLFKLSTHVFLALFVAELVFIIVLLAGDGYWLVMGKARSVYWVELALFFFILTILVFLYGIIRGKYAYRVIRHSLYFEDLPEQFNGFTITQISDIHAGSFQNPRALQRGIDLIKLQQSDLFVFTGDLVNHSASEIKPWIGHFSQIKAPYGQFSVLGNHDYGDYISWKNEDEKRANLQRLKGYHAELGYRLLLDEHVDLYKGGQKIILAGVENWGIGFGQRGDLRKALSGTAAGDFKILLSHDPTHWEKEVKIFPSKVHLTLSGHTHGMQFGIEAFGLKWSPVKYRYPHWAGLISEDSRYLNINRGFGFIGFSGRIGIWPEITVIELKKGTAKP